VELLLYALLGFVQGLTEFLPVSSSGHLILAQQWLGLNPPGVITEVTLHVATLLSVVLVYRHDIVSIFRRGDWRYLCLLAVATAVTVALVLPAHEAITALADSAAAVRVTGAMLIITAGWLAFADWRLGRRNKQKKMGAWDAVVVGLAQAIAVLPGISRSGATIGAAIQLGEERTAAARFSFLLSIPVIAGAGVLTISDLPLASFASPAFAWGLGIAFVTALLAGVLAIHLVLKILKYARLSLFGAYCFVLGLVALAIG